MKRETGSRGGIGERDVWAAADALLLTGARPTVERVRVQMGRGSPNTVGPLLDGWFKALGRRIQNPAAFQAETPRPEIPEPVLAAARGFWEAALAAAREEIEASLLAEREDLARIRDDLDQRYAEFATERSCFDADIRAQRSLIENYESQLRDARSELERAYAERTALITGQERLQNRHEQERVALNTELAVARSELQALHDELAAVRNACDRDLKEALLKIDRSRTEAATVQKALADARERLVRVSTELAAAEKRATSLEDDCAGLQTAFDMSRNDVQVVMGDAERQRELNRTLQATLDTERLRNGELVEMLAASHARIADGLRVVERLRLDARSRLPKLRRAVRVAV